MPLAISNIAWDAAEEEAIASLLRELAISGVEIAPTKIWSAPLKATDAEVRHYREFWESHGIQIVALQALLFHREDLTVFGSGVKRTETLQYLAGIIALAADLGAEVLVFGSPRNRKIGELSWEEALKIAVPFFREIGEKAQHAGVYFCIEPNPVEYGCDFLTTSSECLTLLERVAHSHVRIHLDTGGMVLSREPIEDVIPLAVPYLRHFHVSEPFLTPPSPGGINHMRFSASLRESGYRHWTSIEMCAPGTGGNIDKVRSVLEFVRLTYMAAAPARERSGSELD